MEGVGVACLRHVEVWVGQLPADPRGGGRVQLPAGGLASLGWAVMVEPERWEARIPGVLCMGSLVVERLPPEGIPTR